MMQIEVVFKNIDSSDVLKNYAEEKLEKLTKYFNNIQKCHIVFSVNNSHTHEAKADLHVSGATLYAHATTEDLYASIDELYEKLKHQINKHKEKIQGK